MLDPLLEEDPWVQGYGEKREARGEARGEIRGVRQSIKIIVQMRFPRLLELAMDRIEQIQNLGELQQVLLAMGEMRSERRARRYLQALQIGK